MRWECSECGGQVKRLRAPAQCRHCGTAGVIFVPAETGDPAAGDPSADELRSIWLQAGLEQGRFALEAST